MARRLGAGHIRRSGIYKLSRQLHRLQSHRPAVWCRLSDVPKKPLKLPGNRSGFPSPAIGARQVASIRVLIRLSVFLSCRCHQTYSLQACGVNLISLMNRQRFVSWLAHCGTAQLRCLAFQPSDGTDLAVAQIKVWWSDHRSGC